MSDEILGTEEQVIEEEVTPGAGAETAAEETGETPQGSAGQEADPVQAGERQVPLAALKNETKRRQAAEGENASMREEMELLYQLTGGYPGMPAPPSGRRVEEQPARPSQGRTPFDDMPDDTPITVGEVRPMLDQALQTVSAQLAEKYEGRIGELQFVVSEMGGQFRFKEEWPTLKKMATEVLQTNPRVQRTLQQYGMVADPVEGIALLAAMHPKYKESIKTQAVAGVVKNIKSTLEKPGTAMTAVKPSPVSAYEKYKRDRGKMSLDEATRLLDEALSQA